MAQVSLIHLLLVKFTVQIRVVVVDLADLEVGPVDLADLEVGPVDLVVDLADLEVGLVDLKLGIVLILFVFHLEMVQDYILL